MHVRFDHVDELLQELRRDVATIGLPKIHRGIVRTTKSYRKRHGGAVTELSVLATYAYESEDGLILVRLENHAGDLWGTPGDEEAQGAADALLEVIDKAARGLGLQTRAGLYVV